MTISLGINRIHGINRINIVVSSQLPENDLVEYYDYC